MAMEFGGNPVIEEEYGGDPPCWAHLFEEPDIPHVHVRRADEPPDPHDGTRILVDQEWPAGMTEKTGKIDLWLRDVAPSVSLQAWFASDPTRWLMYGHRYRQELAARPDAITPLLEAARESDLTLIFAAHDQWHNHAIILKAVLDERLRSPQSDHSGA
ncbi:MAG: DUF488 domain-containing protein [Thermomicrobiales bacterium]